jgi:putative ABC transport system substrate-binding protein
MKRGSLLILLLLFGSVDLAQAQRSLPRVGYLAAGSPQVASARIEAFRQGLRAIGYVEGKNIVIEYRNAAGNLDRVSSHAAEIVSLGVDVIVTAGPTDTTAAKKVTSVVPIVMSFDSDPVGNGFVASLARPGGNITGLSILAPELSGKRVELLKELLPKLSRVAALGTTAEPGNAQNVKQSELAAGMLGLQFHYFEIQNINDIERAFRGAADKRAEAVVILSSPILTRRKYVADLAMQSRLPAIYDRREFAEAGGLMTYGVSLSDLDRRAATYVDKILKGANPADIPVEQPTKFDLIINLRAAQQIGLTIPPHVLARADRVIK